MGGVKAAAMLGTFVGWELTIAVLVVSFASGGLLSLMTALTRRDVKLMPCEALLEIGAAVVFVATAFFPDIARAL